MKLVRASANRISRGSSTCRIRKKPVRANPAATSSHAAASSRNSPERNAGRGNSLSFHRSPARHGTPGFRRHIDEIDLLASRSATREVETKTEFRQKLQLEAHQAGSRTSG